MNKPIMTVRELVQKILAEAPDLDAMVFISKPIDEIECKSYVINAIYEECSDDLIIEIKDSKD